jgi:ABC-type branched-subunit amino acid transport system substrate-binding protein
MKFSLQKYFLAFGTSLVLSGAGMAQDIGVAVVGPMTGSEASFGRQFKNGAELAVAEINAAGGLIRFHTLVENQSLDTQWSGYLDGLSDKFRRIRR